MHRASWPQWCDHWGQRRSRTWQIKYRRYAQISLTHYTPQPIFSQPLQQSGIRLKAFITKKQSLATCHMITERLLLKETKILDFHFHVLNPFLTPAIVVMSLQASPSPFFSCRETQQWPSLTLALLISKVCDWVKLMLPCKYSVSRRLFFPKDQVTSDLHDWFEMVLCCVVLWHQCTTYLPSSKQYIYIFLSLITFFSILLQRLSVALTSLWLPLAELRWSRRYVVIRLNILLIYTFR